jgi:hypothetical protein
MTHNLSGTPPHAVVLVARVVRHLNDLRAHGMCFVGLHLNDKYFLE